MDIYSFGEWVKKRRKSLDMTREMLAKRVGCSLSAIHKIENDERRPSRQIAELLALHLEIPPEEQGLFIKIARGQGSIQRLKSTATQTETRVAVSDSFPPSNIPASPSPFIGRKQESESLARMLTDPLQRLITILGPGGIGKTRIAMEAASAQLSHFEGRVYFIQLAAINTVDALLPAIAATLNIPSANTEELKTRLMDHLRGLKVLLVLDNFEHLMDGALLLAELLQKMPLLKLLVTSRERLDLQGEWTFELSGLAIPPKEDEGKAAYGALQLFESHARRLRPDLQLAGAEREAAIRICRRVDGMPLAIELAAVWVNLLSCTEIAAEIERGFDFLSSTFRDVPERHRSLRATFEHSWRRLTASEQGALSRLTIFQGGFSREAAEAVAGADRSALSRLVSKSLVRRSPSGRFELHEVIRQYGLEHLEAGTDLPDRHSKYYLSLLEPKRPAPVGVESDIDHLRELSAEYSNLRFAWEHAIQHKMYADIDKVLDNAWLIYAIHGWVQEGIEGTLALAQSLRGSAGTQGEKLLLARAILSAIAFLTRAGEFGEANRLLEECIEILRSVGDAEYLSNGLIVYGKLACMMGDVSLAHKLLGEGVELAIERNNAWLLGLGYVDHGYVFGQEGIYERAYELVQKGLALNKEGKNIHTIAFSLTHLSSILIHLGRLDEAREALEESLALNIQIHDRWGMGLAYGYLGMLSLQMGELPKARSLLEESLALFQELGMRWDTAWALTQLGEVASTSGCWQEAEQLLKRSLKLSLACPALPQAIEAVAVLADCFARQGRTREALELILPLQGHPAQMQVARQRISQLTAMLEPQSIPGDLETTAGPETLESALARLSLI